MNAVPSGDGLARVSYLPGFGPAESATVEGRVDPESEQRSLLPEFATFFGDEDGVGGGGGVVGGGDGNGDSDRAGDSATDAHHESRGNHRNSGTASPGAPQSESATSHHDALGRGKKEVRAENVSMHALARKGMSRWELEQTLLARDLEPNIVDEELRRLETVGLLDDAALAETFVRTQHERKGLGRSALSAELRRRHVAPEDIERALEQVDDDDEQVRATELALKRAPQLHAVDLATAKRRLAAYLMRKGYASSIIRAAVDDALADRAGSGSSGGRSGGVRFR